MNIKKELIKLAKELYTNLIRQFPDYEVDNSIQHQLAEKAEIDLEKEWNKVKYARRSNN